VRQNVHDNALVVIVVCGETKHQIPINKEASIRNQPSISPY